MADLLRVADCGWRIYGGSVVGGSLADRNQSAIRNPQSAMTRGHSVPRAFRFALVIGIVAFAPQWRPQAAPAPPTIEQFLAPGTPIEVASARRADRIAWTAYEHGLRNVYTAAAPTFAPVRLTNVTKDDGVELSDISISDDGGVVVFVRGTTPNREG